MRKILIFSILYILNLNNILATDAFQLFQSANQAYQTGNFTAATEQYEAILRGGKIFSKEVFYNLGNSYFRLSKIGPSILNYERAARIAPTDADIQNNLILARARIIDDVEPVSEVFFVHWFRLLRGVFTADNWAILGIIFLWVGAGGFAIWLLGKERIWKKYGFIVGCFTLILSIFMFLIAQNLSSIANVSSGIVMSKETAFRPAPNENVTATATLHEGVKVEILDKIGALTKVKLPNSEEGWVLTTDIEKI